MGIDTGNDTLGCRLFITSSSINLTSQKKIVNGLGTQGIMKILRVEVIILHRIRRFKENGVLQTLNSMDGL